MILRKWLRFLAWLLTLPLFAALVVSAYLYLALEESDYRTWVEGAVGDLLGYRLEIRGGLEVEFAVPPTLIASDVSLVDSGQQPPQPLASASRVSFTFELLPLLFKQFNFAVRAEQPRVRYEIDADGRSNWRLPKAVGREGQWQLRLEGLELRQGSLRLRDQKLDVALEADLNQVSLELDEGRLQGTQDIRGVYNHLEFALLGHLALGPAPDELELDLTAKLFDPQSPQPGGVPAETQLQVSGRVRGLATRPVPDLLVHSPVLDAKWALRRLGLDRFAERLRPGTGPVVLTTRVLGSQGQLRLDPLDLRLQQSGALLEASGSASVSAGRPEMVLDLRGRLEDLAKSPWLLVGLSAAANGLGPVEGKARLLLEGEDLSLQDVDLVLEHSGLRLTATGKLLGVLGEPEPELEVSAEAKRLAVLVGLLDLSVPEHLQDASVRLRGLLLGGKGSYRLESIRASLAQDGLALSLEGRVGGLPGQPTLEGRARLRSDRLSSVGTTLGVRLAPVGPVDLSGDLKLATGRYEVRGLRAVVADSEINGDVSLDRRGARPHIRGTLATPRLDLGQLTGTAPDRQADLQAVGNASVDRRIFSADPVPLDWLRRYDFDLEVDARDAIWGWRRFPHNTGRIRAHRGRLHTKDLKLVLGEGAVDAVLEIDAAGPSLPRIALRWESLQAEAEDILALPQGVVRGGKTDGYLRLEAWGNSPRELAASLNGRLLLRMGPAELLEAGLTGVSRSPLGMILRGLLVRAPDQSTPGYTKYRCGVLGLGVEDGVATIDDTLVLEAEQFTVHGYGKIDLARESIDLEVRPFPTTGLGLSVSELIGGFRVAGPLAKPQVQLNPSGLVTALAVDTLTGGPLVRGILRRIQGAQAGCEATFQRLQARSSGSP